VAGRAYGSSRFAMPSLVIKEKVGLKLFEKIAFIQAAEKHRLINLDVPVNQGTDRPLVSGC
jgi:hypothetical protein